MGTFHRLREEADALGCSRVMVIAGGSATHAGEVATTLLGELVVQTHTTIRQHVPEDLADQVVVQARSADADGVVTAGGGSTIGLGKVVAATADLPLIAVPTTYSGSEMTPIFGVTAERKITRRDLRALPRTVIYDPELTLALPARVTAASGLNALAHCMEAFAGPGANPPAGVVASEASRTLPDALRGCVRDAKALEARTRAQYGGFLAGRALALAGTGLQHKIAHVLGGRFGLVHADVHAVLLPYVAEAHQPEAPVPMGAFAEALGVDAGETAADALRRLAVDTGAPLSLAEIGLPRTAIDETVQELAGTYDPGAIRALLEAAFEPRMP